MSRVAISPKPADVVPDDIQARTSQMIDGLSRAGDGDGQYRPADFDADLDFLKSLCPECTWEGESEGG
jgi:hypothetical protein